MLKAFNTIQINLVNRAETKGILRAGSDWFPCALGKHGLTSKKQERDGATPIITTRALYGFYRPDKEAKPISPISFKPLRSDLGWCDDPSDPNYNRLVRLPFSASHEEMWRSDELYDLVIVLDINITCRQCGKGSALFLHVARPGYPSTEGCIALKKQHLRRILQHLTPTTRIKICR